jgi:lipoic acid synthetase
VRPGADYQRSLTLLQKVKEIDPKIPTKSGIMVGLGETESEVLRVMRDLRDAGCELLTIGQYLQPRRNNIPVVEYIKPELFERYRDEGYRMGFRSIVSLPLARSSMDAREMIS